MVLINKRLNVKLWSPALQAGALSPIACLRSLTQGSENGTPSALGAAVISFRPSIAFDPFRIGRNGVIYRLFSPDCIRFTDSIPGLFMFDPVGILNILNGVCGFRFINWATARDAPTFHRFFLCGPLRLCVTCFIVLPRLDNRGDETYNNTTLTALYHAWVLWVDYFCAQL